MDTLGFIAIVFAVLALFWVFSFLGDLLAKSSKLFSYVKFKKYL